VRFAFRTGYGLLAALPGLAAVPARAETPHLIDILHDRMCSNIVCAVAAVDRFFGDERLEEDADGTLLKLALGVKGEDGEGVSLDTRLRLRIGLPQLQHRLQLVFDDDIETSRGPGRGALLTATQESNPDAALRYFLIKEPKLRLSADAGVKTSDPFQVFGKLRGRYSFPFRAGELRLAESIRVFSDDGLDETSELRWSQRLGEWLCSTATSLRWAEYESGVTPGQAFSFFKDISGRRAYRVDFTGTWPEAPHVHRARYESSLTYRQLLYKRWFFLEAKAGFAFEETDRYEPAPLFGLLFEVFLGDLD